MTTIPDVPTSPSTRTETARQALPQIRAIVEGLEGLTFLTPGERLRLSASANVRDRFLETVAIAMEGSGLLGSNTKLTPAHFREMIEYSQACVALADELERLTRGIRDTVKVRRAEVATEALRVFGVARKINRPGDREELVSTVDQMQRALGRGRRKATAKAPAEPVPVSTTQ
jgi:magnesium-transporting ATPase (P-type)